MTGANNCGTGEKYLFHDKKFNVSFNYVTSIKGSLFVNILNERS